jgi:SHS2 domain-containing protein
MKYTFLSHTGDAKFQAYGNSLEESFKNAALALASLIWDPEDIEKAEEKTIKVSGKDREQLLVTFLEEVLFIWESRQFMLADCRRISIKEKEKEFKLEAVLTGDVRVEKYEISGDVKAVTYHEMEIQKNKNWTVQVVVDI